MLCGFSNSETDEFVKPRPTSFFIDAPQTSPHQALCPQWSLTGFVDFKHHVIVCGP
jgi:hypothetical protein